MKKMWAIPVLAAAICVGTTACAAGNGGINQKGANVFPVSTSEEGLDVTMGDVMPFYDDGVMNIYHLRNSTGTNSLFYHPIARLTTSDYIHYTDEGVALNFEEDVSSVDTALGTGSFIKDNNGLYHAFYTGHNDKAGDEGLQHTEVIRHATSTDQKEWVKDEDFKLYGDSDGKDYTKNDFRDPYVYWDSVDNCYYMLITTREKTDTEKAVIKRYSAESLSATSAEWTDEGNFFENDEGTYNMECPSYIELNGYYYLAYSEQGDNRVTHYRYRTTHDGEWQKFERDSIDSAGFYAGRLEKAGDKLYAFAWCARLSGGSSGGFDWGGSLVTHEIHQDPATGELSAVIPQNYKDFFNHKMDYNSVGGGKIEGYEFDGQKFEAHGVQQLPENVVRVSFNIQSNDLKGDFGLSFGLDGNYNNRLGSAVIAFDPVQNQIVCYNGVSSILRYGAPLTSVAFTFEKDKSYAADVIIDGEVVTLYLGGEVALTARITEMVQNNFAFYSNGAQAKIQDINIYE